jgi:hypothetical protein
MAKYIVYIKEIQMVPVMVAANDEKEAIHQAELIVANNEDHMFMYDHAEHISTLPSDQWEVQKSE